MSDEIKQIEASLSEYVSKFQAMDSSKLDKSAFDDFARKMDGELQKLSAAQSKLSDQRGPRRFTKVFATDALADRFFDFLAAGPLQKVAEARQRWGKEVAEKAISVANDANGNFLVPDDFDNTFRELIPQFAAARRFHDLREAIGGTYEYVKGDGVTQAYWQLAASDGNTLTESSPTFDNKIATPQLLYAFTLSSRRAAIQSRINLADMVTRQIARAIGIEEDKAVAIGDGTPTYGNVTGYAKDTDVPSVTVASLSTLVTNTSGAGYKKLVDVVKSVHESITAETSDEVGWYCNRLVSDELMKMLDSQNRPLWNDSMQAGKPRTILGYPVRTFNAMPDGASVPSAGEMILLFGNLRQAGEIVVNGPLAIDVSEHYAFKNNQLAWRGTELITFAIVQPDAVARLVASA